MLHELRKMMATVGEKLGAGDADLRRILNHTAPKSDVLHRHYVGFREGAVADAMFRNQDTLTVLMLSTHRGVQAFQKIVDGVCRKA
jgi:hypothetical protein